jgi:hypothetical protein
MLTTHLCPTLYLHAFSGQQEISGMDVQHLIQELLAQKKRGSMMPDERKGSCFQVW